MSNASSESTQGQTVMQSFLFHRPRWHIVIALPLLVGIILNALLVLDASAAIRICRGDPRIWLSNGTQIAMTASIAADASQVKLITYTVHAPRGLSVSKIMYTGGALANKERVVVLFDRTSGYQIETVTDLIGMVAPVTIVAMVKTTMRSFTAPSTTKIVLSFP
jgi:hypothetical protein